MIYTTTTGGPSALLVENVFAIPEEQGVSLRGKACDSDQRLSKSAYRGSDLRLVRGFSSESAYNFKHKLD